MQSILQNIFDEARARLNDLGVAGGEIFTNTVLQPHFAISYREMYDLMGTSQTSRIRRTAYWILPDHTEMLMPGGLFPGGTTVQSSSTGIMGLSDFAEPVLMEERAVTALGVIDSITLDGPTGQFKVHTATPHGRATGDEVVLSGIASQQSFGEVASWQRGFITVVDASNFLLNGSVAPATGVFGGTASFWSTSTEKFTPVDPVERVDDRDLSDHLLTYLWDDSVLRFRGATTTRQLRITYRASGYAPTSSSAVIGIDNCQNLLACATAARAAQAKNWPSLSDRLKREAYGPAMQADGTGGLLWNFINLQVTAMQRQQRRRRPFRKSRNQPDCLFL